VVAPLNKRPPDVIVGYALDADKCRPFPDLSFHEVTLVPDNVIPVTLWSAPSNHRAHPLIDVGVKYARDEIDISLKI